jgi:probable rRNA maturation factor
MDLAHTVAISLEAAAWSRRVRGLRALVRRVALTALDAAAAPAPVEVSIVLSDDSRVRALNRIYRGIDKPTNVLAFPGEGADAVAPALLGDVVVALETCVREAREGDIALTDHLSHLIVHGILHLMGHDHEEDAQAETMECMERTILARLGIADPYAGRLPGRSALTANLADERRTSI